MMLNRFWVIFILTLLMQQTQAQETEKPRILFGNGQMESNPGDDFNRKQYLYVITKALQSKFVVLDDEDAYDYYRNIPDSLRKRQNLDNDHALASSTNLLLKFGQITKVDKAFSVSALFFNSYIVVTIKVVNIQTGKLEMTYVKEFLNLPNDFATILEVALKDCFAIEDDPKQIASVTKYTYKTTPISTYTPLRLSGPRIGFTYFMPGDYAILNNSRGNGGFGMNYPMLLQIGYQFEKQFTSSGRLQVLTEIVPMITGFDQNIFIPSLLLALGFRDNKTGLELGIGPSFALRQEAKGFYNNDGQWVLAQYATPDDVSRFEYRVDSRGKIRFHTQAVIAVGASFRSGKINIPINFYAVPGKNWRLGFLIGFNIRKS